MGPRLGQAAAQLQWGLDRKVDSGQSQKRRLEGPKKRGMVPKKEVGGFQKRSSSSSSSAASSQSTMWFRRSNMNNVKSSKSIFLVKESLLLRDQTQMQGEAELPPIGAQVELLLEHARELKERFEERSDNSYLLSVAWIERYAKQIIQSLPRRRALAGGRGPAPRTDGRAIGSAVQTDPLLSSHRLSWANCSADPARAPASSSAS